MVHPGGLQQAGIRQLATGKSPEPADRNVCATSSGVGFIGLRGFGFLLSSFVIRLSDFRLSPAFFAAPWHSSVVAQPQMHRGPAPMDERLFHARQLPTLRAAAADLCWLLDHGYASNSATELVGNRYNLASRQRMAVSRCACPAGTRGRGCRAAPSAAGWPAHRSAARRLPAPRRSPDPPRSPVSRRYGSCCACRSARACC